MQLSFSNEFLLSIRQIWELAAKNNSDDSQDSSMTLHGCPLIDVRILLSRCLQFEIDVDLGIFPISVWKGATVDIER